MSLNPKPLTEVDEEMIQGVYSDDPKIQFENASKFRKILSHEENPPIRQIIESGVVPRFVEFLKKDDDIELQYAAASVLRLISEENTKVLIDHGVIEIFVHLLGSATSDVHLRFQATRALGNVARASVESRNYVLRRGALKPVLDQLNENTQMWMLRTAAWTLSKFFSGQPQLLLRQVEPALYALQEVFHRDDEFFLSNACWALYFLSNGSKESIQRFINAGLVPRLVQLLGHVCPSVIDPAVGTIMYLTNGVKQQTKFLIHHGVLPPLANLLTKGYGTTWKKIKRDACWAISNITAGTEEQIQAVIDENLIPTLVSLAQNADFGIKEKAVRAILNAALGGSHDQIRYLVEQGCIKPLCDLLVCPDLRAILKCLNALENILKAGETKNYICQLIEDAEGLEKIENLQHHGNNVINEKALKIMKTYWEEDDGEQTQQPPS